ncbi:unnamed protein product [Enterobius vermicularis]|uniref:Uncharacterized protein n=1 Tax=Enterobius vermicularis TaxID=51028 RepID=A0A0N4VAH3_ENTVE|nr:unnamed protein product [Enterobius vermicularis]
MIDGTFRSTLEDFEDKRSITSAQSCNSVHATNIPWSSYISLASVCSSQRLRGGDLANSEQVKQSSYLRTTPTVHRTSIPQPYPYYHCQQPRITVNSAVISETTPNGRRETPKGGNGKIVGFSGSPNAITDEISLTQVSKLDDSGKVPLIQRYCPSSGSSYSQKIGKSISLDTPVTVAHV